MCPSEVSDIEHSVWRAYQDDDVVVWGIASSEVDEVVARFADTLGLTFPILLDRDGSINERYAQQQAFPSAAYPQDWVIGTDGVVVYSNNAFDLDAMRAAIEAELGGR